MSIKRVLLFGLIASAMLLVVSSASGSQVYSVATDWTFTGRVYAGDVGAEPPVAQPLEGVTVSVYGANNAYPNPGTFIRSTTTDAQGWYGLTVYDDDGAFEYYHILETDPTGYSSAGATTVSGTVRTANWIEYVIPLDGKTLTGNKFWDNPPPETVECNSCTDCSAKLNGVYNIVNLNTDLTGLTGSCVLFNANNVTFNCQGHTIAGNHPGEFSYGIRIAGQNSNTISNCVVSGFEMGVSLISATNSSLISNTLQANGIGVHLASSDGNNLTGNHLTQNQVGVSMTSADSNSFANNVMCKQTKQDIYAWNTTSGNIRSGDKCDSIYNWNGSGDMDMCTQTCTPNITTTCASGTACQNALNGDYGTVTLSSDLTVPGGITVGGNHLTFDCDGHTLTGSGTNAGVVLNNKIGVTVKNCTITGFGSGIELRSAWLNTIQANTIFSNAIGISLLKTEDVLKPEKNSILNNTVWQNTAYGVKLSEAERNDFTANDLSDNALYAAWPSEACNNTFSGNTAGNGGTFLYWHDLPAGGTVPTGNYGLVTLCNVQGAAVAGLTVNNGSFQNDGILLIDSGNIQVRNNWLTHTNGIAVISSTQVSIHSNDVYSSQNRAISLDYSPNASVYTNTLHDNAGAGVFVGMGTGGTQVYNNAVHDNNQGIAVDNTSNVTVNGNAIKKNAEEGITVNGSTSVALSSNTVLQNHIGLFFDNTSGQSTATSNKICYNTTSDIYNNGLGNSGSNNTCAKSWAWQDSGATSGCSQKCIGWYQYNYGYNFANPSKSLLTFGCPWGTCQGDYVDTFGEDQVYTQMDICLGIPLCFPFVGCYCLGWNKGVSTGIPDPHASVYYAAAYFHSGKPGECTGMSTTSLRFYRGDRYVSQYNSSAQKVSDLTYTGSLENALDASHGAIVSWEIAKQYLAWYASGGESPNEVLSEVKQGIQNNQPGSIVMLDGLTTAHTVVAAEVRESGDTALIYVYDSNVPKFSTQYAEDESTYPHITVNKTANTFKYSQNANFSVMWFLPYSVANGSFTIPLGWKQVLFSGWGAADTQVEDESGHVTGWQGGVFTNTIPGAAPMFGWGDVQESGDEFYILPPKGYTAHIAGNGSGRYNVAAFNTNSMFELQDVASSPATSDTLSFGYEYDDPPTARVKFETLDASKPYSLTIGEKFNPSGAVRLYSIQNARIYPGAQAVLRVSPDFHMLIYTNRGPEPVTYTAKLQGSMISPTVQIGDALPTAVRGGLVIEPMSTHVLFPDNWLDLNGSQINVLAEQCGNGKCGIGEGPYNCPEDCGESLPCVPPHDDMPITQTTTLCPGVYDIADTGNPGVLNISGSGATLDCAGAKLVGNGAGIGILSSATSYVTVTNCYVQGYATGVALDGVQHGALFQMAMVSNTVGAQLDGGSNARVTRNYVWGNQSGIHLVGVNNDELAQNLVCANGDVDVQSLGGAGNSGFSNACDRVQGWADAGSDRCTFACTPPKLIYLPLVLRNQ